MDFKSIQELLRFINKSDLTEVEIQQKDFKLRVARKPGEGMIISQMPAPQVMPQMIQPQMMHQPQQIAAPAQEQPAKQEEGKTPAAQNLHTFKSPIIGTFYRTPGPDKEPFVKVGDVVKKGQVLCIIEAMKLFNEIESDVDGKIIKILVESAQPVEYDQALFLIEPA